MIFERQDLEDSALLLVVDDNGYYRWSSTKTVVQVISQLRKIAGDLEGASAKASDDQIAEVNGRPQVRT